jgi:threonine dehydratase
MITPHRRRLRACRAGGIEEGAITLQPCMEFVDEWVSVTELEIADAMCAMLQQHSKLIEVRGGCLPSCSMAEQADGGEGWVFAELQHGTAS